MRRLSRLLTPLLAAIWLCTLLLPVSAAGATATIALSANSVAIGDTLTVTVTFSGDTVGAVDASLSYDAAVLEFQSGSDASGGGGVVKIAGYANAEVKQLRYALTFKALKAGSSAVRVNSSAVYAWDETLAGNPTTGATVTVHDASLSQNANLKSLTLSGVKLSPAFSPAKTSYTATVANSVTSVTVSAVAADAGASVRITGSTQLAVGQNTRTITVTAPGGTTKTYTLTITRQAAATSTTEQTTEATTQPTEPPAPDEPLTIGGGTYHVSALPDDQLPEGFTRGEVTVGEQTIPAATCEQLTLLYLTPPDDEQGARYLYDAAADALYPYRPLAAKNGTVWVLPRGDRAPEGFTPIDNEGLEAWNFADEARGDFRLVYALAADGKGDYYCWDTVQNTLQRWVVTAPATTTPTTAADVTTAKTTAADKAAAPTSTLLPWGIAALLCCVCIALAILLWLSRRQDAPRTTHVPRHGS